MPSCSSQANNCPIPTLQTTPADDQYKTRVLGTLTGWAGLGKTAKTKLTNAILDKAAPGRNRDAGGKTTRNAVRRAVEELAQLVQQQ